MPPLRLKLKPSDLTEIRYRLSIEEPRVIRRANILNCLHLGYASAQIAQILNVDPKTVTMSATLIWKVAWTAHCTMRSARAGQLILMTENVRGSWPWCVRSRRAVSIAGRWI